MQYTFLYIVSLPLFACDDSTAFNEVLLFYISFCFCMYICTASFHCFLLFNVYMWVSRPMYYYTSPSQGGSGMVLPSPNITNEVILGHRLILSIWFSAKYFLSYNDPYSGTHTLQRQERSEKSLSVFTKEVEKVFQYLAAISWRYWWSHI